MTGQLDIFQPLQPTGVAAHKITTVYHNTTGKNGDELKVAQLKASGQTEKILELFRRHPRTTFTPWEVHFHLGQQLMITSIRRAITTLTDAGHLEKTGERRRSGPAGETSCVWKLKDNRGPLDSTMPVSGSQRPKF